MFKTSKYMIDEAVKEVARQDAKRAALYGSTQRSLRVENPGNHIVHKIRHEGKGFKWGK